MKLLYQCWYLLSEMGMPSEGLQGDWNAVSFSNVELGSYTAVPELHLLGRSRENISLVDERHRDQRCVKSILGSGKVK